MLKLEGKVAIITGASKGIGEGIANVYAKYGAKCVLAARGNKVLELADSLKAKGFEAVGVQTDVSDYESVKNLVKVAVDTYGKVDVLVCNAGICVLEDFLSDDESFANRDKHFDINIKGVWNATRAALPELKKAGEGAIVIMSSVTGDMVADPGEVAYATSKAALVGFTKAMAREVADDTMPEEIKHVMYMCTGSEANDLALRVAQEYTGGQGIIVSQEAYHGTSAMTSGCSPSLGVAQPLLPNVRTVATPDFYRHGGTEEEFTSWFVGELQKTIDELNAAGYKFSCFLADSIFSSDGVHPNPVGFLKAAVDVVHKNGGVFIADEVQPGFARTGDAFWGFARHGIIPDMVTMGKPMGNGIPVSALAAKKEVLDAFSNKLPYFNTFGGNPVSIAAAQAVLNVIKEENLQQHCKEVGAKLLSALKDVQKLHPDSVGDVRGAGFFLGFELVKDSVSKTPDPEKAIKIIEMLREDHILSSVAGHYGNILKIRPPMVFKESDIDWFASSLEKSIAILEK